MWIKSTKTIGATSQLINKIKPTSWGSINTLFDSLILSVVLYGVQVWGLRYLELLERVQTTFFKAVCHLPKNTPTTRLEMSRSHLIVIVIQWTLKWLLRVLSMPSKRYPKITLLRLWDLSLTNPQNIKYNWIIQIRMPFESCDFPTPNFNLTPNSISELILFTLKDYKQSLVLTDLERSTNSSSLIIFPFLIEMGIPSITYPETTPLAHRRVLAHLRLSTTFTTRFIFNYELIPIPPRPLCNYCNPHISCTINNYLSHLLFDCSILSSKRKSLAISCDTEPDKLWTTILFNLS